MSEATCTPGPWRLSRTRRYVMSGVAAPWVCEVDCGRKEWEANASLISAAPDLLEALKNLVAIYDDEFGIVAPEMDAARAAIAKAQPSETASGKER